MGKKILWLVLSGLMVLSLVMAACGPAAVEEKPTTPTAPEKPTTPAVEEKPTTPVVQEKEAAAPEAPKYGGMIHWYLSKDLLDWDEIIGWQAAAYTIGMTNGDLFRGDWTRGPAGTGEIPALGQSNNRYDYKMPHLGESFEMPEPGHWIIHIRQGVHYSINKAPTAEASRLVNGREFNAYDAAYALNMYITEPTTYIYRTFPGMRAGTPGVSINATGKYTLEIKVPLTEALNAVNMFFDFSSVDLPKEVIDKYGKAAMSNWKNSVGTGAFMITDNIPGSLVTLVKNPDYWGKDPVGPGKGNQLPYVDGVQVLIIPDVSTRLAALRTGQLDMETSVSSDDGPSMLKTAPQLVYKRPLTGGVTAVGININKPPYNDIRVRKALNMAIDYDMLIKTLTQGTGLKMVYPGTTEEAYRDTFLPFDEAPPDVQEIYTYNPEKAKQLLKEAGYPNGFKTSVVVPSVASNIDNMSILKAEWAKVGVELTLDIKESGAYNTIVRTRAFDQLVTGVGTGGGATMLQGSRFQGEGQVNMSFVNDPIVNEAMVKVAALALTDPPASMKAFKDVLPYVYSQAWFFQFPSSAPTYNFWWPWLKNFYGDQSIGWFNSNFVYYAWIDQTLKAKMGK